MTQAPTKPPVDATKEVEIRLACKCGNRPIYHDAGKWLCIACWQRKDTGK